MLITACRPIGPGVSCLLVLCVRYIPSIIGVMLEIKAMTTREAADRLGLHPRSISRLVESGAIVPAARLDLGPRGSFVFDPAEVERVAGLRAKKAEAAK